MVLRFSLIFLFLAGCAHPVSVLMKSKQVTGGEKWDEIRSLYIRSKLQTSGLEGQVEVWQDVVGGRYVLKYALGPGKGAMGFDGKIVWSQDDSGQVREEQGESQRLGAINEAYRVSLSYWFPDRYLGQVKEIGKRRVEDQEFDVLSIHPRGGREFEFWVNSKTGLIERSVEQEDIQTTTVCFSDYRPVAGVQLPFKATSSNGNTKYDQHIEMVEVKVNVDMDDDLFAKPIPPPPDYEFANGQTSFTVPFRLLNNHIYVEVQLNEKLFTLLLDTGGMNIITPTVAQQLGLKSQGAMEGRGVGEKSTDMAITKIDAVTISGITLSNQLFIVAPLEDLWQQVEGVDAAGLIGYEVFKRFVVHIDYQRSLLTLTLPSAFKKPQDCINLPFELDGHMPSVEGSIDGFSGKFHIDTGSRSTLDLMRPFVEKHKLEEYYHGGIEGITGWGVGGPSRGRVVRSKLLQLGEAKIQQPIIELSRQKSGAFATRYSAGNVGSGILKQFNVTFDYQRQMMFLKPNINYAKPSNFDRSGMWINCCKNSFCVADVIKNGPAAQAGLQPGDTITAINGQPAKDLSLPTVRNRFREEPPNTKFLLTVKREKAQLQVKLVLRDML